MTGVDIIGGLLRGSAVVVAPVPAAQIKAGRLPADAPLPSLLVRSVSVAERLKLRRVGRVRVTERVAVTVRAGSYRDLAAIILLLPGACAGRTGTFGDATNVSTLAAGTGPDVDGPGNTYERTIDFRVSYETAAQPGD